MHVCNIYRKIKIVNTNVNKYFKAQLKLADTLKKLSETAGKYDTPVRKGVM